MNKYTKGEILEPVLILIGLLIVIFLFVLPVGPNAGIKNGNTNFIWGNTLNTKTSNTSNYPKDSVYEQYIYLGQGNSGYVSDPSEEYITIDNGGEKPVTLTGWFLTNAKGTKPYTLNGQLQYTPSDQAVIPNGTTFLTANGQNVLGPIVLNQYDSAIVTTGYVGPRSNIPIVSFKENKCTGYLEADADYTFTPSLRRNCVRPDEEPGFNYLDETCQEYIEGMGTCHIPDYETRDIYGESCRNCVDGRPGLSRSCIAYLKEHFNYAGCLANHSNDADFLGRVWRIFLNRKWEMWGVKKETITLFDQLGKTVNYLSY